MKTRKSISYLLAAGCTVIAAAGVVSAQDSVAPKLATKLDVSYVSKYIWRGAVLNPDAAVQPSLTITAPSGLSYNLWMSENTTTGVAGAANAVVENDHTINYPFTLGKLGMNAGYIYYAFPNTSYASTQELYASACLGGKFSPTVSVNYDCDFVRGAYIALSSGYCCGMPFSKDPSRLLNLSAKLGIGTGSYNKRAYAGAPDKTALLDFVVGANTTFSLGGNYSVTPSISYSTIIDNSVSKVVSEPDNFIAGLTVSSTF